MATLVPKVAKKILELDFIEMAEVTIDTASGQTFHAELSSPGDKYLSVDREVFHNGSPFIPEVFDQGVGVVRVLSNRSTGGEE